MTWPTTLVDLKRHLHLDEDDASENGYLSILHDAAWSACETRIGRNVVVLDAKQAAAATQAMLLLAGHWYRNRETAGPDQMSIAELPMATSWLLQPLRAWPNE